MPLRTVTWVRAGDRCPDLKGEGDSFFALDGEVEVGVVKLLPSPAGSEWMWSMLLMHPGPAFKAPTSGTTPTRWEAVRELLDCRQAFRTWFRLDDRG